MILPRTACTTAVLKGAIFSKSVAQCERAAKHARQALIELPRWENLAPVPEHTKLAFDCVRHLGELARTRERVLALDVGCGTGRSTRALAMSTALKHVDVVGVDRSIIRLNKGHNAVHDYRALHEPHGHAPPNSHIVRADIEHFWRMAAHAGWRTEYQFIFYPNPYPRNNDHKRRLYGRPSFPYAVRLGGRVELRATSRSYLEEFRAAYLEIVDREVLHDSNVHCLDDVICNNTQAAAPPPLPCPISNFEAKYLQASIPLFRLVLDGRPKENRQDCHLARQDTENIPLYR